MARLIAGSFFILEGYMQSIPLLIRAYIMKRDRSKCRICGRKINGGHIHHIYTRNSCFPVNFKITILNNNDQPENLLYVCPMCHLSIHAGKTIINKEAFVKDNIQKTSEYPYNDGLKECIQNHKSKAYEVNNENRRNQL